MREILFRGKRCDNGEWVQGYYIRAEHHWHKHGIHKDWITLGASANGGWFALRNKYAVKAETVVQFAGLTDKNGNKIFEGDVIEFEAYGLLYRGVVTIEGGNTGVFCKGGSPFLDDAIKRHDAVKIGNIHDNPELLENP